MKKAKPDNLAIPADTLWIDLLSPTYDEEKAVEAHLGIGVPTREEMNEIELSNRLYREGDALYLTIILVTQPNPEAVPETHSVTFVLAGGKLITIRYAELPLFEQFVAYTERASAPPATSGVEVFVSLLEAAISRLADKLEWVGHGIDTASQSLLARRAAGSEKLAFQTILERIGAQGDLVSKTRESMVSLLRVLGFLSQTLPAHEKIAKRLHVISADLAALSDHATFLSGKLNFLLDATLGMINIEQNNIIKLFSVAAVVFLPPTLVASIYGMNFVHMPELQWHYGYPLALMLMVLSAIMPYLYFKRRKWL